MRRIRRATLLGLLAGWLGLSGGLTAELSPVGGVIELPLGTFSDRPRLAAQPSGDYVLGISSSCVSPGEGAFYRYVAAGGNPSPVFRDWQEIGGRRYGTMLGLDTITATAVGFDLVWYPCAEEPDSPKVFYRSHLDLRGKVVGRPTRLGNADWIWQLGEDFLAGWMRPRQDAIEARRLTTSGAPAGGLLRLNSLPVKASHARALPLAGGGFLAIWFGGLPRSNASVLRVRRFSAAGEPLGPEVDLNTLPGALRTYSCCVDPFVVATDPYGGFAVAWILDDVLYVRFLDALGTPKGPEVEVATSGYLGWPSSLAFDPAGNLLLLWGDLDSDLQLQLLDGSGRPLGPPRRLNDERRSEVETILGNVAWGGDSWLVAWNAAIYPFDQGTTFFRRFADLAPASE